MFGIVVGYLIRVQTSRFVHLVLVNFFISCLIIVLRLSL